jgi:hypothetical protein
MDLCSSLSSSSDEQVHHIHPQSHHMLSWLDLVQKLLLAQHWNNKKDLWGHCGGDPVNVTSRLWWSQRKRWWAGKTEMHGTCKDQGNHHVFGLLASNVSSLGQGQGDLGQKVQRYIIIINWDLSRCPSLCSSVQTILSTVQIPLKLPCLCDHVDLCGSLWHLWHLWPSIEFDSSMVKKRVLLMWFWDLPRSAWGPSFAMQKISDGPPKATLEHLAYHLFPSNAI